MERVLNFRTNDPHIQVLSEEENQIFLLSKAVRHGGVVWQVVFRTSTAIIIQPFTHTYARADHYQSR